MDTNIINECKSLSLAGKITFPEVVMKLATTTGVERYIIDLLALKGLYYDTKNQFYISDIDFGASSERENFD